MFDLTSTTNHFNKYTAVKSQLLWSNVIEQEEAVEVSITIPTYRRPKLLLEAVKSAAQQSGHIKFEIVIVDNDDSREFSKQIIESLKGIDSNIRYYINDENIGMFGNWNRCIELADASRITILNDDDLLDKDWLDIVSKYRKYSFVKVDNQSFTNQSDIHPYNGDKKIKEKELKLKDCFWGNINPGSLGILMDKQVCLDIGGFNPDLYPTADYDFLCRYINSYNSIRVKANLSYYRWAENESMKKEVLERFVCNDFDMRTRFYKQTPLTTLTCRVLSMRYFERLSRVNPNLDFNVIKEHMNITDRDLKIMRIFRIRFFWSVLKDVTKLFL
ncbi:MULTISPECIES: glycosyltransferase family 2 protein [Vibrio]|uniref:glycosyltransferase family 2 protein n=1 Tax=Vibrio TaxID=662 RepID=UPI0020766144|nr:MULTISPECIES: glycosyltransferase family 2 protein [Vibrio]USD32688.1 glycosyltransferase family 2 protein [Vibrio sp. SCSIO 43186]USD45728.1 glycosyltransferase family 2 protein [Vibrio sp. SCSIO 43145]USD69813.1 glycosyltransferase family 2 protein [Vibrio sp. SCSIO 43139]USD94718.1 hypothetical protein CTT30_00735 [Vibrio coralliilyticus]